MDEATQKALQKPLSAKEIDFRVQSINKGGYATILAYKDARVDMHRLNKVFGVGYWQRKHHRIDGKEFCSVGIWNDIIKQWCWIEDCGTQSNTEAEKGQSSDSFKRACFNLGIGIELYDYPVIQVKLNQDEFKVEGNKVKQTWNLRLKDWQWYTEFNEDNQLTFIAAKDHKGAVRFKWGEMAAKPLPDDIFEAHKNAWAKQAQRIGVGGIAKMNDHIRAHHNAYLSDHQDDEIREIIMEISKQERDKKMETVDLRKYATDPHESGMKNFVGDQQSEGERQSMAMFGI